MTEETTAGVIPGKETRRFHITREVRSGGMGATDKTEECVVACDLPPALARALTVEEVAPTTFPYDWRPVQAVNPTVATATGGATIATGSAPGGAPTEATGA